jgi:hypothetical protein
VLGFVVCQTEIAKCSLSALPVVEPSIDPQIALLAAAGVGQLRRYKLEVREEALRDRVVRPIPASPSG